MTCICETHQIMLDNYLKIGQKYNDLEIKLNQTRQESDAKISAYSKIILEIEQVTQTITEEIDIEILHEQVNYDDEEYENQVCKRLKNAYADKLKLCNANLEEINFLNKAIDKLDSEMRELTSVNNLMCNVTKVPFTQEHYQCFINIAQRHILPKEYTTQIDVNQVYHHIWKRMNDPVFLKYFMEHSGFQPSIEIIIPDGGTRVRSLDNLNECFTIILHQLQKNHTTYEPVSPSILNPNSPLICLQYAYEYGVMCSSEISEFGNYYEPLLSDGKIMDQYRAYLSANWRLEYGILIPTCQS